jgi:hypothetical protein
VLFGLLGDLDYFAAALKQPRWSTLHPCPACPCGSAGILSWNDFRIEAAWLARSWTPATWLAWPDRSKCPLFKMEGVTALTVMLDWMHTKYLGVDQYMFGSVMYALMFFVMPKSPQENMNDCWQFILAFYKQHRTPHRYRYLKKLTMFVRKTGGPKLRGRAAEIRSFGGPLLALWQNYMRPDREVHRSTHLMLKLNVSMEGLMNLHKVFYKLPAVAAEQVKNSAFVMAQLQQQLATFFEGDFPDLHLFSVTTKMHLLLHIAHDARFINPRLTWCFAGEDQQHRVQTLTKASVKGNNPTTAACKMIRRYRVGLHCVFIELEDDE